MMELKWGQSYIDGRGLERLAQNDERVLLGPLTNIRCVILIVDGLSWQSGSFREG